MPCLPFAVRKTPDSEKLACQASQIANFIVNYPVKLFETDLISIVDLNLVPWGNAKIRDNNTFDCQADELV
ncbi:hypothetical protein CJ030_MR8G010089 [Morella rubra]|uniref:Uncharacterized protein n=1 Tax=Morella rubra TaxID=262757 RepID=A0A6A1UPD1_9ROSI|nr:hypothetical protein CJ030_MR8G010089 [Morella rubra]